MKILAIAHMTFKECVRQPSSLMVCLTISLMMIVSPSFSTFTFGESSHLLRSNLLSTSMLGGVTYVSMISTSIFYREIQQGTILSLLSKPISIPAYYLGKLAGIFAALMLFFLIIYGIGVMTTIVGVNDRASDKYNFIPLILFFGSMLLVVVLAAVLNYILEVNIISFIYISWFFLTPIILILTFFISPHFAFKLPETNILIEFSKAAIMVLFLLFVVSSFAIAISAFTSPIVNLIFCLFFLIFSLMSRGLEFTYIQNSEIFIYLFYFFPDFHLFWMGELIHIEKVINMDMILQGLFYSMSLCIVYSGVGVFALTKKDYS